MESLKTLTKTRIMTIIKVQKTQIFKYKTSNCVCMDYKNILLWSVLATAGAWILFFILGLIFGWFGPWCNVGDCYGKAEIFLAYSMVLLPLWFLVVFGGVFLIHVFDKKNIKG